MMSRLKVMFCNSLLTVIMVMQFMFKEYLYQYLMATIVIITACWYAVISSRVSPYNLSSDKNKLPLLHLCVLKYMKMKIHENDEMRKHIYIQCEGNYMPFKIMLTCSNGNSIIKDLRPKNGHPCHFSESDLLFWGTRGFTKKWLRSKGLTMTLVTWIITTLWVFCNGRHAAETSFPFQVQHVLWNKINVWPYISIFDT